MKSDTISRSALIEAFHTDIVNHMQYIDDSTVGVCISEIEEAPAVDAAPEWISVKDRLPDSEMDILVYEKNIGPYGMSMSVISYDPKMFDPYWNNVTHWMPLPEPPKMDAEGGAGE